MCYLHFDKFYVCDIKEIHLQIMTYAICAKQCSNKLADDIEARERESERASEREREREREKERETHFYQ